MSQSEKEDNTLHSIEKLHPMHAWSSVELSEWVLERTDSQDAASAVQETGRTGYEFLMEMNTSMRCELLRLSEKDVIALERDIALETLQFQEQSEPDRVLRLMKFMNGSHVPDKDAGHIEMEMVPEVQQVITALKHAWDEKDDVVIMDVSNPKRLELRNRNARSYFASVDVQPTDIDELRKFANTSAFGRGDDTVIDKEVRNGLEIPSSRFWSNPSCPISSYDTCTFRKLLLYEEGGKFDAHRDSMTDAGHVRTVVWILQTDFEGGDLVVEARDGTQHRAGAGQVIMFWTDMLHWVEEVTSGNRVSLQYDVITGRDREAYEMFSRYGSSRDEKRDHKAKEFVERNRKPMEEDQMDEVCDRILDETNDALMLLLQASPHHAIGLPLCHAYSIAGVRKGILRGMDELLVHFMRRFADRNDLMRTSVFPALAFRYHDGREGEDFNCFLEVEFSNGYLWSSGKECTLFPHQLCTMTDILRVGDGDTGNEAFPSEYSYLLGVCAVFGEKERD